MTDAWDFEALEQRIRDAPKPEIHWRDPFEENRRPGETRQECKQRMFHEAYPWMKD